jgi:hypothetical protein
MRPWVQFQHQEKKKNHVAIPDPSLKMAKGRLYQSGVSRKRREREENGEGERKSLKNCPTQFWRQTNSNSVG